MRLNSFLLREVARSFYELEHVIYHLNLSRHNNAGSHCLRHKIVTVTSITGIEQAEKLSLQPFCSRILCKLRHIQREMAASNIIS